MTRIITTTFVLIAIAATGWALAGNDSVARQHGSGPDEEAPAPQQAGEPQRTQREPNALRDPTEPGDEMRDLVAPLRMGQPGGPHGLAVPRVTLKGRIIGPTQPPAAIIDLQGSMYVVYPDSELTVETTDSPLGALTLQVTEISSAEVRIEVLPLRKKLILR